MPRRVRALCAQGIGWLLCLGLSASLSSLGAAEPKVVPSTSTVRLTLPPHVYVVGGQTLTVFSENLILSQIPESYRFEFVVSHDGKSVASGQYTSRKWTYPTEPTDTPVTRSLVVKVRDRGNQPVAEASTTIRIAPASSGAGKDGVARRSVKLLIVGDSLTHATIYPNELARRLSQPANPHWVMLGTHRPTTAQPGVAHEGYGGWTWEAFASRYIAKVDENPKLNSSPFVFADEMGKPRLDPARYFDERCAGQRPDVVTFLLGINDCFAAPANDPIKLDARIDAVFQHAETLLAAMRRAAPQAQLAVCITPPPNVRPEAFEANYQGRYPRWGWRQIQHRLVERQIAHFAGRERERVFLVPTELNVDPLDGYPANNGVHPNSVGYGQIAETLYAWLKWQWAEMR